MADDIPTCVQHPDTPTRLSCSNCDAPICGKCVRPSSVGQRCPKCARPARTRRATGKPEHYVRAIAAGGATAVAGGVVVAIAGFGSLILSGVLGFFVGRAVSWGTRGQTQPPFPAVAAATAVVGLLVAFVLVHQTLLPQRGLLVLGVPIAGWFATRGIYR